MRCRAIGNALEFQGEFHVTERDEVLAFSTDSDGSNFVIASY